MTTDRTKRQTTSPNKENLDSAGETVNERNVVARPSARNGRPWSSRILGVIGLVAATTVFVPSCALSGSDMQKETYSSGDKRLSPGTVAGLIADTGVDPVYVLLITPDDSFVIGVPPNYKSTEFEDEKMHWKGQGKVEIESIQPATFFTYLRNPKVRCAYYYSQGSWKKKCVEKK